MSMRWAALSTQPSGTLQTAAHNALNPWSIVTGANRGIGYATARRLVEAGRRVVLACRTAKNAEETRRALLTETAALPSRVRAAELDLAGLKSVCAFAAQQQRHGPIDLLVHNAGVLPRKRAWSAEEHELQYAVHVLGPFVLTHLLAPLLKMSPQSKVLFVTSKLHVFARPSLSELSSRPRGYRPLLTYGETKLCSLWLMRAFATDARFSSIQWGAIHPGGFSTALVRDFGWPLKAIFARWMQPAAHCRAVFEVAMMQPEKFLNGCYYDGVEPRLPSRLAQNDRMATALVALLEHQAATAIHPKWLATKRRINGAE